MVTLTLPARAGGAAATRRATDDLPLGADIGLAKGSSTDLSLHGGLTPEQPAFRIALTPK